MDLIDVLLFSCAALFAGFTSGFAGFGTGLVASSLWIHVLPPTYVPLLVAMASVVAQCVSIQVGKKEVSENQPYSIRTENKYYLLPGLVGVPIGAGLLFMISPEALKMSIGALLVIYTLSQIVGLHYFSIKDSTIRKRLVGFLSGILGGFAGLSGVLMALWLKTGKDNIGKQRRLLQNFNIAVLALSSVLLMLVLRPESVFWKSAMICLPITIVGAFIGGRFYSFVSETIFLRIVLLLLFLSGCKLLL